MVNFPSRAPTKLKPAADFDAEAFREMVFSHGLRLTWEQSAQCPCTVRSSDYVIAGSKFTQHLDSAGTPGWTGEPRADCPACSGNGYILHSAQDVRAVITSARSNPEPFKLYGEYANGMISVSFLPEHLPGYQDRFTLLDSVMVYREIRRKTGGAIESLRYPIKRRTLDLQGGPLDFDGVLYCLKTDVNGEVVDGFTPLTTANDLDVTADGRIDWTRGTALGTAPVEGEFYSVAYYGAPRFVVVDHPHSIRDTWVRVKTPLRTYQALPVNAMARLEYLGQFNT